jgi:hypothetical protein
MKMNLTQIEANVETLDTSTGFDFIYDLLAAYGFPKATIARLQKGTGTVAPSERERLLKNKLYYRFLEEWETNEDIHAVIDDAASNDTIAKQKPRFLIVRDKDTLVAMDRTTGETLDVPVERLHLHASFFLPWAGIEKVDLETAHYADIKAAEKMARLYDEISKTNQIDGDEETHALNVFFSRLLFCFFAEDTGIFEAGQVTKAIGSLTQQDGSDLHTFLDQLFEVLDTPERDRGDLPSYLRDFGYVNGSLFSHRTRVPEFSAKARAIILECSELDWSEINPDIFGSMMQAVVHADQRAGLGMHYTSVENIMKVLRPLFLDELDEAYGAAEDDARKLRKLHDRISAIKVFDPACGSGNFLVISYKELRKLEHQILERLRELESDPRGSGLFEESRISLSNFYGIEIDDFAHEIAKLALWLAKHQANKRFEELFGSRLQMIPLTEAGNITFGNAARLNWNDLCRPSGHEVVICGNPPYSGGTKQTPEQTEDLLIALHDESANKYLDYVAAWVYKAAEFVVAHGAKAGLVTTNSITQGSQVSMLWPRVFDLGVGIHFAHTTFRWSNAARGKAGVSCVILGLQRLDDISSTALFSETSVRRGRSINSYLVLDGSPVIVRPQEQSISGLPPMTCGSMARDDGHLSLSGEEMRALIANEPAAEEFLRRFIGGSELLHGLDRYCIWVPEGREDYAMQIAPLRERFEKVRTFRLASKASSTRAAAAEPTKFVQRAHRDMPAVVLPQTSSEHRPYIPLAFVQPEVIVSNAANVVYGATPFLFGILHSHIHLEWLKAVGGKMKSDLRTSPTLVYHTFPVPEMTEATRQDVSVAALGVLTAREQHPDQTLAQLYAPDAMPLTLRSAHKNLDDAVDRIYSPEGFASDDERLATLFEMYEEMTSKQEKLNA